MPSSGYHSKTVVDLSSLDSAKYREELLALRAKRAKKLKFTQMFGVLVAIAAIIVLVVALFRYRGDISETPEWLNEVVASEEPYHAWLNRYGVPLERVLFESITDLLHQGSILVIGDEVQGILGTVALKLFSALTQILFIIIASFRILCAGLILGMVIGYHRRKAYQGSDILGATGNGRLFFSGVRAQLDDVHTDKLIPGLACPPQADQKTVLQSELYTILKQFDSVNETTSALVGILLAHPEWPGSLPHSPEGSAALSKFIEPLSLPKYAAILLHASLRVHAHHATSELVPHEGRHTGATYERFIEKALFKVLTPQQRRKIEHTAPTTIATMVLALEAGKVLSFVKEGGAWIRKSRFQQLAARSVLHSIPSYGKEYGGEERTTIRRALIYASRLSVLGEVRFPLDLSDDAGALRQWSEVLLSPPHEVDASSDEVECYGYVSEAQKLFAEHFYKAISSMDPSLLDRSLATENVCFFELTKVLALIRKIIPEPHRKRIVELGTLLGTRSRVGAVGANDITLESTPLPKSNIIIPAPLTLRELTELSHIHGLSMDDIQEWAGLRSVLLSYGWLSRRVGQSLVPESSLIFGVFKSLDPAVPANELGFFARKGLIAIRATRLEAQFQKSWSSRFMMVDSAEAAETQEQVEKLLRGEVEVEPETVSG